MSSDKIPIGKYKKLYISQEPYDFLDIKLKDGIKIKDGDVITLDMIEPYESDAVRKVAQYLSDFMYSPSNIENKMGYWIDNAKQIVTLVHEAEDADE